MADFSGGFWMERAVGASAGAAVSLVYMLPADHREAACRFVAGLISGLVFGGYLIVHLLVNATIAQGGMVYQMQVDKIHGLPFLPVIEWTFIFLPIIFHTVYGIWITVTGQPNVTNYPFAKNVFYVLQRASAIVIVLFMLFHVLSLKYSAFGKDLSYFIQRKTDHQRPANRFHFFNQIRGIKPVAIWRAHGTRKNAFALIMPQSIAADARSPG